MNEEQFDEMLRDAAQSYNKPGVPDHEAMWRDIERRHFDTPTVATTWWSSSWVKVAAALIIGAGIGRVSVSAPDAAFPAQPDAVATAVPDSSAPVIPGMNEPAKLRYLGQTVALLASVQGDAVAGRNDAALATRASDLLLTTRLLLDSPSAGDPAVKTLLEDLELVLVQIVQMPPKRNASDVDLIKEAMEQRDVMPRLIAAVSNTTSAE